MCALCYWFLYFLLFVCRAQIVATYTKEKNERQFQSNSSFDKGIDQLGYLSTSTFSLSHSFIYQSTLLPYNCLCLCCQTTQTGKKGCILWHEIVTVFCDIYAILRENTSTFLFDLTFLSAVAKCPLSLSLYELENIVSHHCSIVSIVFPSVRNCLFSPLHCFQALSILELNIIIFITVFVKGTLLY